MSEIEQPNNCQRVKCQERERCQAALATKSPEVRLEPRKNVARRLNCPKRGYGQKWSELGCISQ